MHCEILRGTDIYFCNEGATATFTACTFCSLRMCKVKCLRAACHWHECCADVDV